MKLLIFVRGSEVNLVVEMYVCVDLIVVLVMVVVVVFGRWFGVVIVVLLVLIDVVEDCGGWLYIIIMELGILLRLFIWFENRI